MNKLVKNLQTLIFQYKRNRNMRNQRVNRDIERMFKRVKTEKKGEFEVDFSELYKCELTREYVEANFVPMKISDLRRYSTVGYTGEFLYELRWIIFCIKQNKDIIDTFCINRKEIDRLILFGKYSEALIKVEETEKVCGVSFWSYEYRIFLYKQLERNLDEKTKGVVGFILECFRFKNADNISADDYKYMMQNQINKIAELPWLSDMQEYLKYIIIRGHRNITSRNIMKILKYAIRDSIVDQYILLLDICQAMLGQNGENLEYHVIQQYLNKLKDIEDGSLIALRFSYDDIFNRGDYLIKEGLLEAKNKFIGGKLKESYEETRRLIKKSPYNIEAINLYVECKTLLNNEEKEFSGTPLQTLLDSLRVIYALEDERDQNLEKVLRNINILSRSSWGLAAYNSILGRIHQIGSEKEQQEKKIVFAQYLDIETVCHNLNRDECLKYFEDNLNTDNAYVQFRKLIVEGNYRQAKSLCELEILRNLMDICDRNKSAISVKDKVSFISGNESIMNVLNARYFFGRLDLAQDLEVGLEVATDLIVNNKHTVWILPVETYIRYIEENDIRIDTVSVPILYYVYFYYIRRDKKDDLAIRCDDFLYENGITVPSKMKNYQSCSKEKLIYFLRYVCTTDVLNSVICEFETSRQLEEERIDICQLLCVLDKENESIYEDEIREITQKLMIKEELTTIDESRIHVNIEGIKKRVIENINMISCHIN